MKSVQIFKIILFVSLLVNSLFSFSQNKMEIHFYLCNSNEDNFTINNEYKIIFNDSTITNHKNSSHQNLPDGKYQIEYKTYFGWKKTRSFLLFNETVYSFDFCIDKLDDDNPIDIYNIGIDIIKNQEELIIVHNYSGCFNSGGEKIIVKREKNNYFLTYGNTKRKLKKKELKYFRHYETELVNLDTYEPNVFCTAFSSNSISYQNHFFEYSESCPKWNGFQILKEKLKLTKNQKP